MGCRNSCAWLLSFVLGFGKRLVFVYLADVDRENSRDVT